MTNKNFQVQLVPLDSLCNAGSQKLHSGFQRIWLLCRRLIRTKAQHSEGGTGQPPVQKEPGEAACYQTGSPELD